jgi:hypothetical protein
MRRIKISNSQNRDADISYGGITNKSKIRFVLPDGSLSSNGKLLKSSMGQQYAALVKKSGNDEALVELLINGDPEIDIEITGAFIKGGQQMLVDENLNPVFEAFAKEIIYNPDGSLKEEKSLSVRESNILSEFPVRWTGKYLPLDQAYNKFIFTRKYQLTHTNGLTFDFLFAMAKDLSEKNSLMMLGAGAKGNEPLVFQDNGKPYRAFLEGRIKGESYLLLMHLTNLELKGIL